MGKLTLVEALPVNGKYEILEVIQIGEQCKEEEKIEGYGYDHSMLQLEEKLQQKERQLDQIRKILSKEESN